MIGIVADDLTGAHDIGSMFAKAGYVADVYVFDESESLSLIEHDRPDVLIVDTGSRYDAPARAYAKVAAATRFLQANGCDSFYKKICSVFRGNVGAELDAALDTLEQDFMLVVAGFPKNGRTTIDAVHYVHGVKLEDSAFRHDPVHPMAESNLVELLRRQTKRPVAHIDHRVVDRGTETLRARIDELRAQTGYAIVDVIDQAALRTIGEATQDKEIFSGSSGLAEELAVLWNAGPARSERIELPRRAGAGIMCVAGSLTPQTAAQVEYLQARGTPVFGLKTMRLFDAAERADEIGELVRAVAGTLERGADAVIHSSNRPEEVRRTQAAGAAQGRSASETSRLVSDTIAQIVAAVIHETGQNRLLVTGGDTASAVCAKLGIRAMRIWQEIEPGVPSCVALSGPRLMLVLKAGGYGAPTFFERALAHLRESNPSLPG
jgi:uncharacterized protein YgbK (DUF1537 family)